MKKLSFSIFFIAAFHIVNAQVNGNGTAVPNTGANTTVPPTNTLPNSQPDMSNPTNSTVPGPTGSYSVDPGKPEMNNPNAMGSYTVSPNPPATFSPQTATGSQQKKKTKK